MLRAARAGVPTCSPACGWKEHSAATAPPSGSQLSGSPRLQAAAQKASLGGDASVSMVRQGKHDPASSIGPCARPSPVVRQASGFPHHLPPPGGARPRANAPTHFPQPVPQRGLYREALPPYSEAAVGRRFPETWPHPAQLVSDPDPTPLGCWRCLPQELGPQPGQRRLF